jgi:hypothetical protein
MSTDKWKRQIPIPHRYFPQVFFVSCLLLVGAENSDPEFRSCGIPVGDLPELKISHPPHCRFVLIFLFKLGGSAPRAFKPPNMPHCIAHYAELVALS